MLRDRGFASGDAPEGLKAAVDGAVQAILLRDGAFARVVESGGPISLRGRNRSAFRVWMEAGDRAERYLKLLGLERRAHLLDSREPDPRDAIATAARAYRARQEDR